MLIRELPILLGLGTQFIDPIFHLLYSLQVKVYQSLDIEYKRICETLFTGSRNQTAMQFFSEHDLNLTRMLSTLEMVHRPFKTGDETDTRSTGGPSREPSPKLAPKPVIHEESLPAYNPPSSSGFATFHDAVSPKNYGAPINPPASSSANHETVVAIYDYQRYCLIEFMG